MLKFGNVKDMENIPTDEELEKKFQPSSIGETAKKFAEDFEKRKKREGFKVAPDDGGMDAETSTDEDDDAEIGEEMEANDEMNQMEKEAPANEANGRGVSGLMTADEP